MVLLVDSGDLFVSANAAAALTLLRPASRSNRRSPLQRLCTAHHINPAAHQPHLQKAAPDVEHGRGRFQELALAAVAPDHLLNDAPLKARAIAGVGLAVQLLGALVC